MRNEDPPPFRMSSRLQQAIVAGMVRIYGNEALIVGPPNTDDFTDDDWMQVLRAASEMQDELARLGYEVKA